MPSNPYPDVKVKLPKKGEQMTTVKLEIFSDYV
jgi:hypothetical protein